MAKEQHTLPWDRLNRLAWLLDNSIRLPGLNYRIGLDPLIGLVPGIGETVGALLSMYIVVEAARSGVPLAIIMRMGLNVVMEVLLGSIPLIGDLFDMAWKANARNMRLMQRYAAAPRKNVLVSTLLMWMVILTVGMVIAAGFYVGILILRAVWTALTG
ncbi:MAG: DUF4112 domain-containing protein [Desulfobacteraceae bacterium]|nr:MAG: DUF4112 domain-containing protein [Desulfobacteraceae bacterium]